MNLYDQIHQYTGLFDGFLLKEDLQNEKNICWIQSRIFLCYRWTLFNLIHLKYTHSYNLRVLFYLLKFILNFNFIALLSFSFDFKTQLNKAYFINNMEITLRFSKYLLEYISMRV